MSYNYGYDYSSASDAASTILSTGAIVGIVIGGLAGLAFLIGIIVTLCICCKKKTPVFVQQQPMNQTVLPMGGYGQGQWQQPQYYPPPPIK
jgi:hypothetical protein